MILTGIEIENFKGILNRQHLPQFGHVNALIGRNNSGKTSLLEALTTLRDHLLGQARSLNAFLPFGNDDKTMTLALAFRLTQTELQTLMERLEPPVEIQGETPVVNCCWELSWNKSYVDGMWHPLTCVVSFAGQSMLVWDFSQSNGRLSLTGWDGLSLLISRNHGFRKYELNLQNENPNARRQTVDPDYAGQFFMNLLIEFARNIQHRPDIRMADNKSQTAESWVLNEYSNNLAQVLHTLNNNREAVFKEIKEGTRDIVGEIDDLGTPLEGTETATKVTIKSDFSNEAFYLSEVGFGTQQVLVLLTTILTAPPNSLILIEEPEICLHADAQRRLSEFIKRRAEENQFQVLMTTHSPLFAPSEDSGSTYIVKWTRAEGTTYSLLRGEEVRAIKPELGWRNVDLFMKDGVVFWDGDSEHAAMPILISALGYGGQLTGLWPVSLQGSVSSKLQTLREFLRYIKDSDVRSFVIADDDEGVTQALQKLVSDKLLMADNLHVWGRDSIWVSEGGPALSSPGTGREFENNFSDEQLVRAANLQASENGQESQLTVDEFIKRKERSQQKISKVLSAYYYDTYSAGLDKPDLNLKLAQMVAVEVERDRDSIRGRYEFERAIQSLMSKVYPSHKDEQSETIESQEES